MTTERFINQASAGWTTYGTFLLRRAWNDGAEKLRPGYCSMASIGSLHHRHACRRESPVRLDAIHYRPDRESACKPESGPVDPHFFQLLRRHCFRSMLTWLNVSA